MVTPPSPGGGSWGEGASTRSARSVVLSSRPRVPRPHRAGPPDPRPTPHACPVCPPRVPALHPPRWFRTHVLRRPKTAGSSSRVRYWTPAVPPQPAPGQAANPMSPCLPLRPVFRPLSPGTCHKLPEPAERNQSKGFPGLRVKTQLAGLSGTLY